MVTPSLRACSTTIRFATEPSTVRLPASVLDNANASQAVSCSVVGMASTTGLKSNTAGTFDTTFDNTAESPDNTQMGSARAPHSSTPLPVRTCTLNAPPQQTTPRT